MSIPIKISTFSLSDKLLQDQGFATLFAGLSELGSFGASAIAQKAGKALARSQGLPTLLRGAVSAGGNSARLAAAAPLVPAAGAAARTASRLASKMLSKRANVIIRRASVLESTIDVAGQTAVSSLALGLESVALSNAGMKTDIGRGFAFGAGAGFFGAGLSALAFLRRGADFNAQRAEVNSAGRRLGSINQNLSTRGRYAIRRGVGGTDTAEVPLLGEDVFVNKSELWDVLTLRQESFNRYISLAENTDGFDDPKLLKYAFINPVWLGVSIIDATERTT